MRKTLLRATSKISHFVESEKKVESFFQLGNDFKASCVFNENKRNILAPDMGAIMSRLKYP